MRETKFTPGPWTASKYGDSFAIFDEKKSRICYCYGSFENRSPEESGENAHLIAAAPELYEALEACISTHCPDSDKIFCGSCTNARKILAKARGESA